MWSAFFARRLSSLTTFSLPGRTSYRALQSLSGSTPIRATNCSRALRFLCTILSSGLSLRVSAACLARSFGLDWDPLPLTGRSRMCPTLDFTMKSEPRYLLMVFAFAGDSTITRLLPISEICILGDKSVDIQADRKLAVKSIGWKNYRSRHYV